MRTQILFLKDEYTFRFSNFLITGICNFYANCWLKKNLVFNNTTTCRLSIKSFTNHRSKQTIEPIPGCYMSCFGILVILNALHVTLY